jgi:hypothetical protein
VHLLRHSKFLSSFTFRYYQTNSDNFRMIREPLVIRIDRQDEVLNRNNMPLVNRRLDKSRDDNAA